MGKIMIVNAMHAAALVAALGACRADVEVVDELPRPNLPQTGSGRGGKGDRVRKRQFYNTKRRR